jgi:ketosteroid isomerase-like protein
MDPKLLVDRLQRAVNDHDIETVVGCFAPDYRNETPAHPSREFTGVGQVRANWQRIFDGVPDVTAAVRRSCVDGDEVWSEWEIGGTRVDGRPQMLRGVIIFGASDNRLAWSRFYLEPVDTDDVGIAAAVGRIIDVNHG